jgi:uncharacterized damage-inducible protein DinB
MDGNETLQKLREQQYSTLTLADQIKDDRWREPLLSGGNTVHAVLSHLLAWDEWAIGAFEVSLVRDELPPTFQAALDDVDAFNDRAMARYRTTSRDDLLTSLQTASGRMASSATAAGGEDWAKRRLNGLSTTVTARDGSGTRTVTLSVGGVLRTLTTHEAEHMREISEVYGVSAPSTPSEAPKS